MISLCDIHCHILPGVDDGCADVAETLQVLQTAREQGVRDLIATPHYYVQRESVDAFLRRRADAYASVLPQLPANMRICLGAEVAYFNGIHQCAELEQLCLGNSRFLLLELPYAPWDSNVLRVLQNLICIRGFTPILAHVERYWHLQSKQMLREILSLDVLVQMNGVCLLRFPDVFLARRLLKKGMVQLLGSDCHNTTDRSYCLGKAAAYMQRRGMSEQLRRAANLSAEIFDQAYTEKIL